MVVDGYQTCWLKELERRRDVRCAGAVRRSNAYVDLRSGGDGDRAWNVERGAVDFQRRKRVRHHGNSCNEQVYGDDFSTDVAS